MKRKQYKVWICVEEYDPEKDDYEDSDLNFAATATFDTAKHAIKFATELHKLGKGVINPSTNMDVQSVGA